MQIHYHLTEFPHSQNAHFHCNARSKKLFKAEDNWTRWFYILYCYYQSPFFFAKVAWSWDLIFYSVLSFFTRLTHLLFCTISGLHVDTLTDLNFTQVYVWMKNCSLRSKGQTVAVLTGALKILLNSGKPTGLGITSSAVISSAGCTQQQSPLPFQLPWLPFGPPILTFKMQAGEPVEGGGDIAGGRLASGQFFRRSPAHWRGLCWKYNFSQCSFSQCYCISSMFA